MALTMVLLSWGCGQREGGWQGQPLQVAWAKQFRVAESRGASTVAVNAEGSSWVAGYTKGKLETDALSEDWDGHWGGFVSKLDAHGTRLWTRGLGRSGPFLPAGDARGNVYVASSFRERIADFPTGKLEALAFANLLVAKLDADGRPLWAKTFGAIGKVEPKATGVDPSGSPVVAGEFTADPLDFGGGPLGHSGGRDVFVVKLDPNGSHLWSVRLGGRSQEHASDMAVDTNGNVIVTGIFEGTVALGSKTLRSANGHDVFVAKLDAKGLPKWIRNIETGGVEMLSDVAVTPGGVVFVVSHPLRRDASSTTPIMLTRIEANGDVTWRRYCASTQNQKTTWRGAAAADAHNRVLLAGRLTGSMNCGRGWLAAGDSSRAFIALVDADGGLISAGSFGVGSAFSDVTLTPNGNMIVVGATTGGIDLPGAITTGSGRLYSAKLRLPPP